MILGKLHTKNEVPNPKYFKGSNLKRLFSKQTNVPANRPTNRKTTKESSQETICFFSDTCTNKITNKKKMPRSILLMVLFLFNSKKVVYTRVTDLLCSFIQRVCMARRPGCSLHLGSPASLLPSSFIPSWTLKNGTIEQVREMYLCLNEYIFCKLIGLIEF